MSSIKHSASGTAVLALTLALPCLSWNCMTPALGADDAAAAPKYPALPSETPATFVPPTYGADFVSRDVMIPMRDGVRLHTIIMVPKGARNAGMLLTRTPYKARQMTALTPSLHLGARLWGYDNAVETIIEGGYIRVVQDIRGKYDTRAITS